MAAVASSTISTALLMLIKLLPKDWLDEILDKIEKKVQESPGKVDDWVVLPLCRLIREKLNIPDTD